MLDLPRFGAGRGAPAWCEEASRSAARQKSDRSGASA